MQFLSIIAATVLSATSAQPRNHTGGAGSNPMEVARAAYRTADDAEALQRQAGFSCANGQGYQLSQAAYSLHTTLSDLYWSARRAAGGQRTGVTRNHQGDAEFDALFDRTEQYYAQVQSAYSYIANYCNSNIQSYYQSLQYDYSYLAQTVGH